MEGEVDQLLIDQKLGKNISWFGKKEEELKDYMRGRSIRLME